LSIGKARGDAGMLAAMSSSPRLKKVESKSRPSLSKTTGKSEIQVVISISLARI
jgi:hypothetical protein